MLSMVLTEEQRKLAADNMALLWYFVAKVRQQKCLPNYLFDDFISKACWNYCISVAKFDEKLGFKFSTYAYGAFKFALKDVLAQKERDNHESHKKTFRDIEVDLENIVEEDQNRVVEDFLYYFIGKTNLTEIEIGILKDYYFDHLSFAELGRKYGKTREWGRWVMKRIIGKLKQEAIMDHLTVEDFYD